VDPRSSLSAPINAVILSSAMEKNGASYHYSVPGGKGGWTQGGAYVMLLILLEGLDSFTSHPRTKLKMNAVGRGGSALTQKEEKSVSVMLACF
jgi:hypothetical protein